MDYNNNDFSYCNVVGQTDIGRKRKANEDHGDHFVTLNGLVSVVCDGMGGHVGGAIASDIAVKTIHEFLDSQYYNDPREAIGLAIDAANEAIIRRATYEPELSGMGSTCVLLIVRGGRVFIGHVGDSRIYLVREKKIIQLTKDHSFVQSLVDIGEISPEEAEHHPRKNEITNALGIPKMMPATVRNESIEPQAGDCFLLCSDGLSGMVDSRSIEKIISRQREYSTQQRADLLVQAANNNGGIDNITVELVEFSVTPENQYAGKKSVFANKTILGIVVGCIIAIAILLFFIITPVSPANIEKVMSDVEFAPDNAIYELFIDQKSGVTSIRNLNTGVTEKIADKSIGLLIKSNLIEEELEDGKYKLSFPHTFNEDSLYIDFSSKKNAYRYSAAVLKNTIPQIITLPEILFRQNQTFVTIVKDEQSIIIEYLASDTPIKTVGTIDNVEVSPKEAIIQSNDYKIALAFPKKYSYDKVIISYDCDGVNYKYIIPIINSSPLFDNGDALKGFAPEKPIIIEESTASADTVAKVEQEKPSQGPNVLPIGLLIKADNTKPILVIRDSNGYSYNMEGTFIKIKQLVELDESHIDASPSLNWIFDNDQYIFRDVEQKPGNKYTITIPGKDNNGNPIQVKFTVTLE